MCEQTATVGCFTLHVWTESHSCVSRGVSRCTCGQPVMQPRAGIPGEVMEPHFAKKRRDLEGADRRE